MLLYNGADCDITKRIEIRTRKRVKLPLMHVYRDAAVILAKMEKDGPLFDYRQHKRLIKAVSQTSRERSRRAEATC